MAILSDRVSGATDEQIKTAYENNADTNAFTDAEQTKLTGIATSATANSSDATLLNRANHTGIQLSSTITTDFSVKPAGAYTVLASDNGKVIEVTGALTIPTGLGAGFTCTVFLNNGTLQTLTTSGLTLRGGFADTSISANGLVTMTAIAVDTFWIKGETE
jgi:hypothetical protein